MAGASVGGGPRWMADWLGLSLANPGNLGDEHHVTMATLLG